MNDQKNEKRMLYIASDHAGFALKTHLLKSWNGRIVLPPVKPVDSSLTLVCCDLGPFNDDRVDYPDFAQSLCRKMLSTPANKSIGILICGSGQGMAMSANRFDGIRAALTWDIESTRLARAHNDANILCLGARLIEPVLASNLVEIFLRTPFEDGRHSQRISKIDCH